MSGCDPLGDTPRAQATRTAHVLVFVFVVVFELGVLQGDRWFQLERLAAFNRRFPPTWEPHFAAHEHTVDLPQAALAVLAAEGLVPLPRLPIFGADDAIVAEPTR